MTIRKIGLTALLSLSLVQASFAQPNDFWTEDVWKSPDRGFLFYGEKKEENTKELSELKTVEELKQEAKRRLDVAVMEPTKKNITAYLAVNTLNTGIS